MLEIGKRAGVEPAKDFVAIAGNEVVKGVTQRMREELPNCAVGAPHTVECIEDKGDGVGAGEDPFVGLSGLGDDIECVEGGSAGPVAGEDFGGDRALKRGEAEEVSPVMAEGELDETVAESADTVVEEDGVGRHWVLS